MDEVVVPHLWGVRGFACEVDNLVMEVIMKNHDEAILLTNQGVRIQYWICHSGGGGLGYLWRSVGRGSLAILDPPTLSHLSWMASQLPMSTPWYPIPIDRLTDQERLTQLPPALPVYCEHFGYESRRVPPSGSGRDLQSRTLSCLRDLRQDFLWQDSRLSSSTRQTE